MSGDCNREVPQADSDGTRETPLVAETVLSTAGSSPSSAGSGRRKRDGEFPKKFKLSKNELLDSAEFNKTIATWFGEKGFIAMRSFFRASVLNSLQKDKAGLCRTTCTDSEAMIITLIADYLVKNGKYFTMSVFSNEVLRPLINSNVHLKQVLHRIGKCEDLGEPTLTHDMVSHVLHTLNIQPHTTLGAGILQKYLDDGSDLFTVLMTLLRDNATLLSVQERAVRDDDVVAAFSAGLHEEMGKLHGWFSSFNNQFVDVSGKVRKLICTQAEDGVKSKNQIAQGEQELWAQILRMDEHLKKQQEILMKMRDDERRKLATYAKELEDLHHEMSLKLKSMQDYEKTLKARERALRERETVGVALVERCDRGDHVEQKPKSRKEDARDISTQCFNTQEANPFSATMTGQIMQENLELRAILREQNLRIDALTKKTALLSNWFGNDPNPLPRQTAHDVPRRPPCCSDPVTPRVPTVHCDTPKTRYRSAVPGDSLVSAMTSSLRRARMELDNLRDEQNTTDLQYDRLMLNKLSKRL